MKNSVIIDTKKYDLKEEEKNYLIYQYCFSKGTELPCFCYNENLEIAGNCRICLVEIEKMPKLLLACATKIEKNYDNKNKKFVILKKIEKLNENLNNFIKYEKYKYKTEKFI
jgi:NADH dehydrogenase/NADH:ubiquinone oxidoreductase subunit G